MVPAKGKGTAHELPMLPDRRIAPVEAAPSLPRGPTHHATVARPSATQPAARPERGASNAP
ncbi:hypothetical protein [Ktedonobacter sp. SOSP1-85]|uniref:hypothetical protein n=1 Tax=Ktedonobacter sp. SOSP1-85 TaxID=2778367 RepID=UPI0019157233|nr:hypothetical protein [Ktedonobacter sp. SOSP1-85]